MWDWIKALFKRKSGFVNYSPDQTRIIEHRGIKGYFSPEMIKEFEVEKIDYEKYFRESVDEFLDEQEEDDENPYR